jgi:hypothetical protein
MRKPSGLISCSQPGPAGGRSTNTSSHGRRKPTGGFLRQRGAGARHVVGFKRSVTESFQPNAARRPYRRPSHTSSRSSLVQRGERVLQCLANKPRDNEEATWHFICIAPAVLPPEHARGRRGWLSAGSVPPPRREGGPNGGPRCRDREGTRGLGREADRQKCHRCGLQNIPSPLHQAGLLSGPIGGASGCT